MRAHILSASGRRSKVIKDLRRIEASVEVPGMGRLILSVEAGGRYALHAGMHPEGGTSSSSLLAAGEMSAAELD